MGKKKTKFSQFSFRPTPLPQVMSTGQANPCQSKPTQEEFIFSGKGYNIILQFSSAADAEWTK